MRRQAARPKEEFLTRRGAAIKEKKKALLVSAASPYPTVTSGCERLVGDYLTRVFSRYDAHFLHARPGDWAPRALYRGGRPLATEPTAEALLELGFELVFFVGFRDHPVHRRLAEALPSFCLTDVDPHPDVPAELFDGVLAHRAEAPRPDLVLLAGSYDERVFYKDRRGEDFVLSVGRIDPEKNQLELVRGYRERIYARHGLPLRLVGGVTDPAYGERLRPYVDGESVLWDVDPERPPGTTGWLSARRVAALASRARVFVSASPRESFGLALVEALACGATAVVEGAYSGFDEADLAPQVWGNVTGKRVSILDRLDEALAREVRIDGSRWARKYSLRNARETLLGFVDERLPGARERRAREGRALEDRA